MNWGSIVGLIVSLTIFCGSIAMGTKNWHVFIDPHAIALVIGGSFAAVFMSFRARYVLRALGFIIKTLRKQNITPQTLQGDVKRFVEWSRVLHAKGLEGLSEATEGDVFMQRCIYLAKQEYKEEDFVRMATTLIENDYDRQ